MSPPVLERYDTQQAQAILDHVVDIYINDVYAEDPVFSDEQRFRNQIAEHQTNPQWELITATIGDELVGYIYGFALSPSTSWWQGLLTDVPPTFTAETGQRTLAISELLVRKPWRRQHIATALHDELLAQRHEQRGTLFVRPENTPAYNAYRQWGWQTAAQIHPPFEGAPVFDVLIREPLRKPAHLPR